MLNGCQRVFGDEITRQSILLLAYKSNCISLQAYKSTSLQVCKCTYHCESTERRIARGSCDDRGRCLKDGSGVHTAVRLVATGLVTVVGVGSYG